MLSQCALVELYENKKWKRAEWSYDELCGLSTSYFAGKCRPNPRISSYCSTCKKHLNLGIHAKCLLMSGAGPDLLAASASTGKLRETAKLASQFMAQQAPTPAIPDATCNPKKHLKCVTLTIIRERSRPLGNRVRVSLSQPFPLVFPWMLGIWDSGLGQGWGIVLKD